MAKKVKSQSEEGIPKLDPSSVAKIIFSQLGE